VKSKAAREFDAAEKKKTVELFKNTDLSQYAIRGSEDDWKSALASGPQGIISVKRSATATLHLITEYNSSQHASSLRELTCHVDCGIIQCYLPPGTGDIPAFSASQLKLVLDLVTPEGCKAELT